jgi:hypothetical protein
MAMTTQIEAGFFIRSRSCSTRRWRASALRQECAETLYGAVGAVDGRVEYGPLTIPGDAEVVAGIWPSCSRLSEQGSESMGMGIAHRSDR